jgi:hypothetical protein
LIQSWAFRGATAEWHRTGLTFIGASRVLRLDNSTKVH